MNATTDKNPAAASIPQVQEMNIEQIKEICAQYTQAIAAAMAKRMVELGLSQQKLADKMDCTQQYISKVLKGKKNMSLETICKIEQVLGIEIIRILD